MIYLKYKIQPIHLHHQTIRTEEYETLRQVTHHEKSMEHLQPLVEHHLLRSTQRGVEKNEGGSGHAGKGGNHLQAHFLRQTKREGVCARALRKERLGVSLRKKVLT